MKRPEFLQGRNDNLKSKNTAYFTAYIDARDIYLTKSLFDACQPMKNKAKPGSKIMHLRQTSINKQKIYEFKMSFI